MQLSFQWVKSAVTLVAALLTTLFMAVGAGSFSDLSTSDWVQTVVLFLGGSVVVGLLDNIPGVFGGVIKALVGAAVAGLTAWQIAYENDHVITDGEWLGVAIAVIGALAAVYQIPDGPVSTTGTVTLPRSQV